MWRRQIFKVSPPRKPVVRSFEEESENRKRQSKTEIKDSENKKEKNEYMNIGHKHFGTRFSLNRTDLKTKLAEYFKLLISCREYTLAIIKEDERLDREQNVILFGKQGYGIDLMRTVLQGTNCEKSYQISENDYTQLETDDKGNESKDNASSPKIEFFYRFGRKVKVAILDPDDKESLLSLLISEEHSVVFCFPVSFRFTAKDLNLLETYLKYRQREDYRRVTIAFTYSERLDCDKEVYIDNLPEKFKEYLEKFRNSYVFIHSSWNKNDESVQRLIRSGDSEEYLRAFANVIFVFLAATIIL